jgi:hypothetical protein
MATLIPYVSAYCFSTQKKKLIQIMCRFAREKTGTARFTLFMLHSLLRQAIVMTCIVHILKKAHFVTILRSIANE